jgi:hypothetical protein
VAVNEEYNVDGGAERLSASAFLARYESFRYIETGSEMKMSDASHSPLATCHSLALTRDGSVLIGLPSASLVKRSMYYNAFLTETAPQTEIGVTYTKQTTARFLTETRIDHPKARVCFGRTIIVPCQNAFLTGSAPQTECDVTCSKQTTEKFLTGARTDIRETRIRAKMNAQIRSKSSAQMSETRMTERKQPLATVEEALESQTR